MKLGSYQIRFEKIRSRLGIEKGYKLKLYKKAIKKVVARIMVTRSTNCWIYIGKKKTGAPLLRLCGYRTITVSRLIYAACIGPCKDMLVRHRCRNSDCCNPRHLALITRNAFLVKHRSRRGYVRPEEIAVVL